MTEEELAQVQKWQHTDGGRAELAMHGMSIAIDDLKNSACTRDGFSTIRKSRSHLISARESLSRLIEATSLFREAAE